MRTGSLIVGILVALAGILFFLTIVLWPVGVLFIVCAVILFAHAMQPQPMAVIVPVSVPPLQDEWFHPRSGIPPPPQSPLPVVVRLDQAPLSQTVPVPGYAGPTGTVGCQVCGHLQRAGAGRCTVCGATLPGPVLQ